LEKIGTYGAWIYMAFCAVNGIINMQWDELDFTTLFEAIEGPQAIAFVGAMNVSLPANVQIFLSSMRSASSVDTEDMTTDDGKPTADEDVYGEEPVSEPLNDNIAAIGFPSMDASPKIAKVSVMFAMQAGGILILLFSYFGHRRTGSMLADRVGLNLQKLCLWGTLINLIMLNYLPVTVALFINVVGFEWNQRADSFVIFKNTWTLFMISAWIACPLFLMIQLYRKRTKIGSLKDGANVFKDFHKVKYSDEWLKYKKLQEEGKKPYGIFSKKRQNKQRV
jgi:hypothetical protein